MRREQFIYFMQNLGKGRKKKGPIKIGITFNVKRRLKQAQTFNCQEIKCLGFIPGHQRLETALLNRFESYNIRGEWFTFNDELYNLANGIFDVEYERHGDRNYLVLYRETPKSKTDPCPFCLEQHIHGLGDGHRVKHCVSIYGRPSIMTTDGTRLNRDDGYIVKTRDPNGPPPEKLRYNRVSKVRLRACANLLTFAVNRFIESNAFTLDPDTIPPEGGVVLFAEYPDGMPCKIRCNDAGYGEIGINVLYGIKCSDPPMFTFVTRQSKEICSAHATGFLERREGKHLQISAESTSFEFFCEKHVFTQLANLEVRPVSDSFKKQERRHF